MEQPPGTAGAARTLCMCARPSRGGAGVVRLVHPYKGGLVLGRATTAGSHLQMTIRHWALRALVRPTLFLFSVSACVVARAGLGRDGGAGGDRGVCVGSQGSL